MRPGCHFSAQLGTSLLELTVAMAMAAILAAVGLSQVDTGPAQLAAAHQEIRGSLDQATAGELDALGLGQTTGWSRHSCILDARQLT